MISLTTHTSIGSSCHGRVGGFYGGVGGGGCGGAVLRVRNYSGGGVHKPKKRAIGYRMVCWTPPKPGTFKLNTDGASKGNPGPAYCGGVIRDGNGTWVRGFHRKMGFTSSIAAELCALRDGLTLAKIMGVMKNQLEVEVDCKQILVLVADRYHDHGHLNGVIDECRYLLGQFGLTTPRHIYREANQCADVLANINAGPGCYGEDGLTVYHTVPFSVVDQLVRDASGVLYPRTVYSQSPYQICMGNS